MSKNIKLFLVFLFLFIIFFSLGTELPKRQRYGFFSDESSYFGIIQSLAFDFDLKYTRTDIKRIKEKFRIGPTALFLKKGDNGQLTFAKSFVYPLFAAPFFRIFGVNGLLLFNGLMIWAAIVMAFLLLRQYHSEKNSILFSLVFLLASVLPVYTWWITADLFNFFTVFTGLFFFFYKFKNPSWFYLAPFFFTLAVFSKPFNVVHIGIIYLVLLFFKQWKKFIVISFLSLMMFMGMIYFYYSQTGELSYKLYMGGERRTFLKVFPFEKPENKFEDGHKMTFDNYWDRYYLDARVFISNLFYYFFGRFTGMFIYFFPAFFVLMLFFLQRKTPEDWFLFAAITAGIIFYLTFAFADYFGGSGSLGNRYFLSIFPLFFFLGLKHRIFKFTLAPVLVAILLLSPVFADSLYHSVLPRNAGISFPIKFFPPEKTLYLKLPTNENPRAYGKIIGRGENRYWIYFLNDNFHELEGDSFWTIGTKQSELFVATLKPVREFEIRLHNIPIKNRVTYQIEHKTQKVDLNPRETYTIGFKHINGFLVDDKYVYHIKVKCSNSYFPFFDDQINKDGRVLGIFSTIKVNY